eukprot:988853-Amphidinium_carterae.1
MDRRTDSTMMHCKELRPKKREKQRWQEVSGNYSLWNLMDVVLWSALGCKLWTHELVETLRNIVRLSKCTLDHSAFWCESVMMIHKSLEGSG